MSTKVFQGAVRRNRRPMGRGVAKGLNLNHHGRSVRLRCQKEVLVDVARRRWGGRVDAD
jgi:hypothetical protein